MPKHSSPFFFTRLAAALLPAFVLVLAATQAHAASSIYACFGSGTITSNPQISCAQVTQRASIIALSMGGTDPVSFINGAFTSGKAVLSNITLLKDRDIASNTLLTNVYAAKLLPYVAIAIYDSGSATPAINILLTNVSVTSTNWGTAAGSTGPISESVTLAFQKLAITDNVTHQNVTWNLATQAPTVIRNPPSQ